MLFNKGAEIPENKITAGSKIKKANIPDRVVIPLKQHIGSEAKILVKEGDYVKTYQKIGEAPTMISADVHSSVSGKVIKVEEHHVPDHTKILSVIIESDGKDKKVYMKKLDYRKAKKEDILKRISESGIVGLGGACFPTNVKLNPKQKIDTFILNGCECESYLTCDHQIMLEHPNEIIDGLKIMMKVTGAKKGIIGIEDNKKDAIELFRSKIEHDRNISVKCLKTRYPEGAEKILIRSITGRVVPAGKLPADVNIVVNNVQTAKAIYDAVCLGIPLVERVITITGDVKKPGNISVRIGSLFKDLVNECKGYKGKAEQIIASGPMMGQAQFTDEFPIIKGTSGVIVLNKADEIEINPCFRCGKCVDACPYDLMPSKIALYSEKGKYDLAEKVSALDCIECGCCSYVCPTRRPLVQLIKVAKKEICKSKDEETRCIGKPSS